MGARLGAGDAAAAAACAGRRCSLKCSLNRRAAAGRLGSRSGADADGDPSGDADAGGRSDDRLSTTTATVRSIKTAHSPSIRRGAAAARRELGLALALYPSGLDERRRDGEVFAASSP